jgi:hypothetical protein
MKCKHCQAKLKDRQRLFCSVHCKNKSSYHKNQDYTAQQRRGLERKWHFVKQMGGKCSTCGYDKNLSALLFHHIDPSTKEYGLDMRYMSNNSMESLEKEVSKCQLLCHNCHAELHYPRLKLVGPQGIEPCSPA